MRFSARWSLRSLLYALSAAVFVPMALLVGLNIVHLYETGRDVAEAEALRLAQLTADTAETFINDAQKVLATMARRPQMATALAGQPCDPIFASFKDLYPQLSNMSLSNPEGFLICSALPQPDGKPLPVAHMEWFQQAYARKEFVVGPILFGPINRNWISVLAEPVRNADGEMIGAVQTPIDLHRFRLLPAADKLPQEILISVMDTSGNVVARSRNPEGYVGRNVRDSAPILAFAIAQGHGTAEAPDTEGVLRYYGFTPIEGTDWIAFVGIDSDHALAGARKNAFASALLGLPIMALVLLLAIWLSQRIGRPIRHVSEATQLVGNGQLDVRVPLRGPQEIREVAQHFNAMLEAIKESQTHLRRSEARLKLSLESSRTASWDLEIGNQVVHLSETWSELMGGSPAAKEIPLRDLLRRIPRADRKSVCNAYRVTLQGNQDSFLAEHRIRDFADNLMWTETQGRVTQRDVSGRPARMLGVIRDITKRKQSEHEVLKLSRYYAARSRTNGAIIRAKTPHALLSEVCRIAVEHGQLALVWVGRIDTNGRDVIPVASSGAATGYLREITVSTSASETVGLGPFGCATREDTTRIVNDIATDPVMAPWHSTAHQFGLQSLLVCPLKCEDGVWGGIAYYSVERDYFNPELVQLLEDLASDVAFSLDAMETRRRRAEAEEHALLNAKLIESSHEGIFILDDHLHFTLVNEALCTMTGYTRSELFGSSFLNLEADQSRRANSVEMLDRLETIGRWEGETLERRKDGSIFPAWKIITTVRDERLPAPFHVGFCIDVSLRKEADSRMQHLANHDQLTNLPNRAVFRDRLNMAIKTAARQNGMLAVLFVDLDRFKLVNDTLGHEVGDMLLREVSTRIVASLRAADTVSRVGGDEFIVLLSDIAATEDAARVAEKILDALGPACVLAGHQVTQHASVGIAIYPNDATDTDLLLSHADTAMYTAKRGGRARYAFYSPEMGALAMERLQLETALRNALARREISVVYQPQYDLAEGRLVGYEVLARWLHPELGQISPARFIPVAEESGLIREIGTWVLNTACHQARDWLARGLIKEPVAVNVSAVQFRQSDFVSVVATALQNSGLPAEMLELEVTESVIMEGIDEVLKKLDTLHAMGIKLAIDDFGTGYSSLSYLRRFPTQRLKMDQSFVRDLPDNPDAVSIARAIVSLGRGLGMAVIAEGVETRAQADFLRSIWCSQAQGYLYSYPLTADQFEARMRSDAQASAAATARQTQT